MHFDRRGMLARIGALPVASVAANAFTREQVTVFAGNFVTMELSLILTL